MSQLVLSDSFGLRPFKAEIFDDLLVEEVNLLVAYYMEAKGRELAEYSHGSSGGKYEKQTTVRIASK